MKNENKILIIGIGNSGRRDDGLGWDFVDKIQAQLPKNFDFEYRYQLNIEDAALISQYHQVIFVDAHKVSFNNGFIWERCHGKEIHHFSTHELPPESIVALAENLYQKKPIAYILGISGFEFSLQLGISDKAIMNLEKAVDFFRNTILLQLES